MKPWLESFFPFSKKYDKNQTQLFLARLLELLADWPCFCLASLVAELATDFIVDLAIEIAVLVALKIADGLSK